MYVNRPNGFKSSLENPKATEIVMIFDNISALFFKNSSAYIHLYCYIVTSQFLPVAILLIPVA